MQKEYLTQEEKELIELLHFMKKFFRNFPSTHPQDLELKDKFVVSYEKSEETILSFAKSREEFLEWLEADKYRSKQTLHDVICLKCDAPSTSKPLKKDFKNPLGLNFLSFKCPKCL